VRSLLVQRGSAGIAYCPPVTAWRPFSPPRQPGRLALCRPLHDVHAAASLATLRNVPRLRVCSKAWPRSPSETLTGSYSERRSIQPQYSAPAPHGA
jgi:hypothetical protein